MGFYCANLALESPAIDGLEINAGLDSFGTIPVLSPSHLHRVTSFEHTTLTPVEIS